jgi:hypothetical protein
MITLQVKDQLVLERLQNTLKAIKKGQDDTLQLLNDQLIFAFLERDFARNELKNKLAQCKRVLVSCEKELQEQQDQQLILTGSYLFSSPLAILNPTVTKKKKLELLIGLIEKYLETNEESLLDTISILDTDLCFIDGWQEIPLIGTSFSIVNSNDSRKKRYIIKRLRRIICNSIFRIWRDLRYNYRTIIKFLFKNMDDESGNNIAVFELNSKQHLSFIQQHITNGTLFYHTTITNIT